MNIGILGTGIVGRTLAIKLVEQGHSVGLGTRDPARTLAQTEPDRMGSPPVSVWLKQNTQVVLGTFAEAAAQGELVINATNGSGTLDALKAAGESNLDGKNLNRYFEPPRFFRWNAAVLIHQQYRFAG